MKKSFAIMAVILAVFSMLYFSGTALAGKAYLGVVSLDSESGTVRSSMTFNYTFTSGFSSSTQKIQVSKSTDFSSPVQANLSNDHTITVNCSSLSSGQAYWRIVEESGDDLVEISTPDYKGFQLPVTQ